MSFVVEIDPVDNSVAGNALLTASVGAVSLIAFLVKGSPSSMQGIAS